LLLDEIALSPVCMSMKQPVPYVFFTIPGLMQRCPNSSRLLIAGNTGNRDARSQ
jgi:hypothetical protein